MISAFGVDHAGISKGLPSALRSPGEMNAWRMADRLRAAKQDEKATYVLNMKDRVVTGRIVARHGYDDPFARSNVKAARQAKTRQRKLVARVGKPLKRPMKGI